MQKHNGRAIAQDPVSDLGVPALDPLRVGRHHAADLNTKQLPSPGFRPMGNLSVWEITYVGTATFESLP